MHIHCLRKYGLGKQMDNILAKGMEPEASTQHFFLEFCFKIVLVKASLVIITIHVSGIVTN